MIFRIACIILVLGLAAVITPQGADAQQRGSANTAQAAYDCDYNASFTLSSESGELNDTVKVYFSANTNSTDADMLQITFTWSAVTDSLTYIGLDTTGYILHPDSADFRDSLYNDTLRILVDGGWDARSFDGDTILAILFRLECMTDGEFQDIAMLGACTDDRTWFHEDGASFVGVMHDDGEARIKPLTATMSFAGTDSTAIKDTAELLVEYTADFDVVGGYGFHCCFDTSELAYVGLTQTGYASSGHTLTDTVIADTLLRIRSADSDTLPLASAANLFGILFENNMSSDSAYADVYHRKALDTMFMCSEAYAINSTTVTSGRVFTPPFTATFDIEDMSVYEGDTATMEVQLTNNHQVDMQVEEDTSLAAFRLDADEFDYITVATSGSDVDIQESGRWYYWQQVTGLESGRRVYHEDDATQSGHIFIHTSPTQIAGVHFTANQVTSTRYDWIFFEYATDTEDVTYKKDMQLKALNLDVTIRPDDTLGDDHLVLDSGRITVYNYGGGGGSCPFVYTWAGSEYVLEDVILTECENLSEGSAVQDYLPLTFRPVASQGLYRIRIHEQEAEKTFLDYVELVTVDHPIGYRVSTTPSGRVVLGRDKLAPIQVVDDEGYDVTGFLEAADDRIVKRSGAGHLIATFEGRPNASYAIPAWDSVGTNGGDPKPDCKIWAGPSGVRAPDLNPIRTEVEDIHGIWHELPSGPMRLPVARARPFVDLSEFDLGGTFRVRCSWESDFELDEFSVVVTAADVEHKIRHTPIRRLVHSSSHPTAPLAKRADGACAELVTGEFIDLEFPAEPLQPGMERSFILAAKGYYLTWYGHENAGRPLEFGLNGNYPNPFNPSTTIRYSLAADAVVTLEVFNVLGQRVRTLVQGESQLPGSYEVFWDGKDAKGREVGSGAYLYRIKAGDFVETRKAIMLK